MSLPRVEGYVVAEKIGVGSYATVYKAFTKTGARDVVAIKSIERAMMISLGVDKLITEIRLLKTLRHPNIVEMKDFLWDDKYVYIVMELCNAGDLSKHVRQRGGVPEKACRRLLRHLASALKQLRDKGIAHMDLKPQNLLLNKLPSGEMTLKIADFGLAQYMTDETRLDSLRGSPLYMAPEMFLACANKGSALKYDAKCDLWSVGVILYECLFGKAPYCSNSFKELIEKIKNQQKIEIPTNCRISEECRDFLHGLLQHDPATRMSYEDFFSHDFLDLKHMPSPENYAKAVDLVKRAIQSDTNHDFEAAYHLYCESLRYFVPMVTEEMNVTKKTALRTKVNCYIARAEQLKVFTTCGEEVQLPRWPTAMERNSQADGSTGNSQSASQTKADPLPTLDGGSIQTKVHQSSGCVSVRFKKDSSPPVSDDGGSTEELPLRETEGLLPDMAEINRYLHRSKVKFEKLYGMCSTTSHLQGALESGLSAEMYVRDGRLDEALRLYHLAIATLLKGCQREPPGERRTLLAEKIDEWLREAESIKALQESQQMQNEGLCEEVHKEYCCIQ